jgi:hypothetical protein
VAASLTCLSLCTLPFLPSFRQPRNHVHCLRSDRALLEAAGPGGAAPSSLFPAHTAVDARQLQRQQDRELESCERWAMWRRCFGVQVRD